MSNKFQFHLTSNVGKVRKNNEDFYGEKKLPNGHVFVVCDGMGGHSGGEIASQKAVECILEYFTKSRGENPIQMIHEAIKFANSQVHGFASMNPEYKGMGTTCVVVFIDQSGKLFHGHVGDSRLYRFNRQGLKSITKDHSYVQYLVDTGEIKENEMESHPAKNQILRALGTEEGVKPDVCAEPIIPQSGDTFLLCSDGLNGMIGNQEISEVLQNGLESMSLPDVADKLIHHALEAGGKDNVTVALIAFPKVSEDITVQINNAPPQGKISDLKNIDSRKLLLIIAIALIAIWMINRGFNKDQPSPSNDEKIDINQKVAAPSKEKNIDTGANTIDPDSIKQSESKIEYDSEVQKKRTDEQEVEEEPEEKDQLKAEEPVKK